MFVSSSASVSALALALAFALACLRVPMPVPVALPVRVCMRVSTQVPRVRARVHVCACPRHCTPSGPFLDRGLPGQIRRRPTSSWAGIPMEATAPDAFVWMGGNRAWRALLEGHAQAEGLGWAGGPPMATKGAPSDLAPVPWKEEDRLPLLG